MQKNKKELSEYKAIGMIQEHVSLLYQAIHKNTQDITKLLVRLFPSYRRMDGNLTDMRKNNL
ncbi:Transposase [Bacillus thuringiensis serovar israelensis ATCC 35646]|nr:Transposase [Bacillus thuringiensis serovar israelensis ATCC 35646]